jgi:DNA-binding NarL/FixJ family response regulator
LILQCLIEGYSNKCIARKIDVAEAIVKVHVRQSCVRFECRTGHRRRFGE